ncbi:MAG: hypothetical protein ACLQHF_10190 [Terracidiphilus sp.]
MEIEMRTVPFSLEQRPKIAYAEETMEAAMLGRALRVGLWALGGALVVYLWALVVLLTSFSDLPRYLHVVATITVPASLFWRSSTSPPDAYFLMFLNAVTYALVGLAIEFLLWVRRKRLEPH